MVGYGPFQMFVRLKMTDEYSSSVENAKKKLDDFKASGDQNTDAQKKLELALQRSETRATRANLTVGVLGATMLSHGLITLGVIDKHSKLGEVMQKSIGIIQVVSGMVAALTMLKKTELIETMKSIPAKLSEAYARWFNAGAAATEATAISWGMAAVAIASGIGIAAGAVIAAKGMGWFQTKPGEYKRVPRDMLGMVHAGEIVSRHISNSYQTGGSMDVTINISGASSPFETAREVTYELEKLKRRGR